MRKVKCFDLPGISMQEVLDEFNERRLGEFGIKDDDIISVSVRACTEIRKIERGKGPENAQVVVSIVYWGDEV
jgi:hypothetical protein